MSDAIIPGLGRDISSIVFQYLRDYWSVTRRVCRGWRGLPATDPRVMVGRAVEQKNLIDLAWLVSAYDIPLWCVTKLARRSEVLPWVWDNMGALKQAKKKRRGKRAPERNDWMPAFNYWMRSDGL